MDYNFKKGECRPGNLYLVSRFASREAYLAETDGGTTEHEWAVKVADGGYFIKDLKICPIIYSDSPDAYPRIKPVPLDSPETLKDAGFERVSGDGIRTHWHLAIGKGGVGINWFVKDLNMEFFFLGQEYPPFVHVCQNIYFAATGEELITI